MEEPRVVLLIVFNFFMLIEVGPDPIKIVLVARPHQIPIKIKGPVKSNQKQRPFHTVTTSRSMKVFREDTDKDNHAGSTGVWDS